MTFRVGLTLHPGVYFDAFGVQRECILIAMGDKIITALDRETLERVPDPENVLPVSPPPE